MWAVCCFDLWSTVRRSVLWWSMVWWSMQWAAVLVPSVMLLRPLFLRPLFLRTLRTDEKNVENDAWVEYFYLYQHCWEEEIVLCWYQWYLDYCWKVVVPVLLLQCRWTRVSGRVVWVVWVVWVVQAAERPHRHLVCLFGIDQTTVMPIVALDK